MFHSNYTSCIFTKALPDVSESLAGVTVNNDHRYAVTYFNFVIQKSKMQLTLHVMYAEFLEILVPGMFL